METISHEHQDCAREIKKLEMIRDEQNAQFKAMIVQHLKALSENKNLEVKLEQELALVENRGAVEAELRASAQQLVSGSTYLKEMLEEEQTALEIVRRELRGSNAEASSLRNTLEATQKELASKTDSITVLSDC